MSTGINLVAKAGIRELRELGIEPTLDEIILLHELGKKVQRNGRKSSREAAGRPVKAGDVYLWPFTIGASMWYMDGPVEWFRDNERMNIYVLAFALSHARDCSAFVELVDYRATVDAVKAWVKSVSATYAELVDGITMLFDQTSQDTPHDQSDPDWGAFIGFLTKHYGGTPDFWRWEEPMNYCVQLCSLAFQQERAAGQAPDPNDPHVRATWDFRCAINAIKADRKEGENG